MSPPRRSDIAAAVLRPLIVMVSAVVLAAAAGPGAKAIDSEARASFARTVDETKQTMLGDPLRAQQLARGAAAVAKAWPAGAERDFAIATAQWLEGEADYRANDIAAAGPLIAGALKTAERVAPKSKLNADLLLSHARIAVLQGATQTGLSDLQNAFAMFESLKDARSQAKALQSIGSIYQDAQDFERALGYYKSASDLYPDDPRLSLSASNNIANAYARLGRLDEAETEFKRALTIARKLKSPILVARILNNIGDVLIDRKKYVAARATINEGLALTSGPAAGVERPTLLATAARLALAEGRSDAAVRAVEEAFATSDKAATDQSYRQAHLTAYQAYKMNGDYERALDHLEAFRALDDAGRTLATSTSSALMAAKFDSAYQASRIAKLETTRLQTEARQRTMLLVGLLVLGAAATLFVFAYLRSLRRSRNEIMAANLELAKTNTELAEALLAKSQFLATTSHEIRTPLNGILGMTQVMLADRTVTGEIRARIGLVDSAGRSMRTLVDDILDFAKMDSGALVIEAAPVDIAAVLPDLVALWRVEATDKGISLGLEIDDALLPLMTDIVRLRQIIFNLLSNAVKFTTEGSVRVTAGPITAADGEQLAITFRDTGVGIPDTAFETIFEPFRQLDTSTTRRFGGTGLGLAISRHLARALGGDIIVESELGAGSVFSLRLPYTRAVPAPASPSSDENAVTERTQPRLLIVGSNPIGRSMLRTRLSPRFDRCVACDVEEAVERAGQSAFDLVLVDAEGLDEDKLITLLDMLRRPPRALAVLAPATMQLSPGALGEDATLIGKPISVDALVDALVGLSSREPALMTC